MMMTKIAQLSMALMIFTLTSNPAIAKPITDKSSEIAKVGYSFGYLMGEGNKQTVNDLDLEAFYQGFKDAYQNKKSTLTSAQMQQTLLDYQKRKESEHAKKLQDLAKNNLQKSQQFLAENGKKSGIVTTKSGLQYQILTPATGKKPNKTDRVKVHYEGRLLDGKIFDTSYQRGEPITFPLNEVIAGWTEGLQLMSVGAKYRFYIPANLAYGALGTTGIEPNVVLIFDVELLEIQPSLDSSSQDY